MNRSNKNNDNLYSMQVLLHSQVNTQKIVYDDFCRTDDSKYAVSKLWYDDNESVPPRALYIQSTEMKLHELTKSNDIVFPINKNDNDLFDKIDNMSLDYVKNSGIVNKYKLKDVKFKTIVNEIEMTPTNKTNVLKLRVSDGTKFFMGDKTNRSFDDVKKYLTKGLSVIVIIEIDKLVIDTKSNVIATNVVLKQVLLKKLKPVRIELEEYSFVESDLQSKPIEPIEPVVTEKEQTEKLVPKPVPKPKKQQQKKKQVKEESSEEESEHSENSNKSTEESNESVDVANFLSQIKKK